MKVTGGQARGRAISSPNGLKVRPTAAKVRQAFFNILSNKLYCCRFLDLFAGSGLMGIEALSRGALHLTCVEENYKMFQTIQANLANLGYKAQVICGDTNNIIPNLIPGSFDIIFADPPYKSPLAETTLVLVSRHKLLAADGILVIEHTKNYVFPQNTGLLQLSDCRHYGQTSLSFFRNPHS